jgi:hypothetical protein
LRSDHKFSDFVQRFFSSSSTLSEQTFSYNYRENPPRFSPRKIFMFSKIFLRARLIFSNWYYKARRKSMQENP